VTKPYSPRELRARVKAHLRRRARPASDVYRFGDAELDFVRCELRRGGKPVDLSALEFKLLAAFVTRAGRLLTRAQLLDEVWGSNTHVTDRVVDNQVTNLRKKIEPNPDRPRYLVSLRGLGYRFDGEGMTER
jgi:DNA-binding response OmpR family regulator